MVVLPQRPGAERQRPARRGVVRFLPFLITLAAGAIVVAIVALAISGHSTHHATTIPLPPPSPGSTPPANVHP